MIQMYTPEVNRDPDEVKAFEVFKAMIDPFKNTLNEYVENLYESYDLGNVLYEQNATPIRKVWDNPHDAYIYSNWHSLYMYLQNCDGIIEFINALYKQADTQITIYDPLVLSLLVDVNESIEVWWNRDGRYNLETIPGNLKDFDDERDAQIFVKDSDDDENARGIIFDLVTVPVSDDALSNILRDVVYPGLYYNVTVIK